MRKTSLVIAVTVAAAAALAASASANTTVMGSTLANDFDGGISTGPTLSVQLSYDPVTSPNPVVSPANGVITGWKVKSADDGAIYSLKVMRPVGAVSLLTATNTTFTGVTSVQAPTAVPAGTFVATPTGVIFDYPASLPISKGDYIGVLTGGADDHVPQKTTGGLPLNLFANNFAGQPADGASAALLADEQHDLLLQATVKYCKFPNLVGQARAAIQAPLTAADCGSATVVEKPTTKAAEVGKVITQDPAADATAAPGTGVKVEVGVASGCKKAKKKKGKKGAESAAKKKGGKKGGCKKKKKKKGK